MENHADPKPVVEMIKKFTKVYPYQPGGFGTPIADFLSGKAKLGPITPLPATVFHEGSGKVLNTLPADEAIAQVAAHHPDVVLMDVQLANGTSGIEAAREIYQRHTVACIFVSANLNETKEAVLPYKPIDFVGKPVLPRLLQRALEKAEIRA
jgi:CheY-like chemotaxis protein